MHRVDLLMPIFIIVMNGIGVNADYFMTLPSCYEVLGVATTCSIDDVRRAYHQKVRKYHPDKRPNDVSSDANDSVAEN